MVKNYDDETPITPPEVSVQAEINPPIDYRKINTISALNYVLDTAKAILKDIDEGLEVTEALFVRADVLYDVATSLTDQYAAEISREAREAREANTRDREDKTA